MTSLHFRLSSHLKPTKEDNFSIQLQNQLNMKQLGAVVWTASVLCWMCCQGQVPTPTVTVSAPTQLGKEVVICCQAKKWEGKMASLSLRVSGVASKSFQTTLNDRSVELCQNIMVQMKHHETKAECEAFYGSGRDRRGALGFINLYVFKLTDPQIEGPETIKSAAEDTWMCKVDEVTYDNKDEFSLSWRVDGVVNSNEHTTTESLGYADPMKKRLSLHKVESKIRVTAPVNPGTKNTSLTVECIAWHISLQLRGNSVKAIHTTIVWPDPTATTTPSLAANETTTEANATNITSAVISTRGAPGSVSGTNSKWTVILEAVVGTLLALIALTGIFYWYVHSTEKKEQSAKKKGGAGKNKTGRNSKAARAKHKEDWFDVSREPSYRRASSDVYSLSSTTDTEATSNDRHTDDSAADYSSEPSRAGVLEGTPSSSGISEVVSSFLPQQIEPHTSPSTAAREELAPTSSVTPEGGLQERSTTPPVQRRVTETVGQST